MISQINNRGWLYVFGIICNRIIPQRLFRFRLTGIYTFHLDQLAADATGDNHFKVHLCSTPDDRQQAATISWYQAPASDQGVDSSESEGSGETGSANESSLPEPQTNAYLGSRENQPVAAVWLAENNFVEPELGLSFQLPDQTKWLFAANVCKPARRQGVYRQLLTGVYQLNQSTHFYAAINPTNKASMAAHRTVIAKQHGWYLNIRLVNIAFCYGKGELQQNRRLTFDALQNPIELTLPPVD